VLGVFADDRARLLWVCSSPAAPVPGAAPAGETGVKSFDLQTGAFRASYTFPGGTGTCNDIAVAADGTMYATDTPGARVLRLRPGATTMDMWAADPLLASVDGIAILADGAVYINTYSSGLLVRLAVSADGRAAAPVKLQTSRPIVRPDGMRTVRGQTLLLVEGDGHLDEVVVQGSRAEVRTLKDGFVGATAVTLVGREALVLESKLNYRNDPALRDKDPGPFRAISVLYTPSR
jgi:sugar lactone lactonase YvrE